MVNHDILHWYRVGYWYLGYRGISGDIPREPEIETRLETEHNDTNGTGTQGTGTQNDRKTPFHGRFKSETRFLLTRR